jgi:hypothetical protein
MNEEKFSIWALGFAMGVLLVIGLDRMFSEPYTPPETESLHADKVLELYNRGKIDALTVSGSRPNFELEQACLTLWATKEGFVK